MVFGVTTLGVWATKPSRYVVELQIGNSRGIMYCNGGPRFTLQIHGDTALELDGRLVNRSALVTVLDSVYALRPDKLLHLVVDKDVPYGELIGIVGEARSGGVRVFVIGPPGVCDPHGPWPWRM